MKTFLKISFMLIILLNIKIIQSVNISDYGLKRLNEWTFLTTHNSHVNWDDSSVVKILTNQDVGIQKQLEYGVRGFMFDIDWKICNSVDTWFQSCKCEGICLCHGQCSDSIKDGFDVKNLDFALKMLVNFLEKKSNKNEIITIFFENYINDVKKIQSVFNQIKGFNNLVFNPYSSKWNVSTNGWPKIIDMIKANKRILIVDDEQRAYSAKYPPGFIRSRDFLIQNHYQWFNDKYVWENFNRTDLLHPDFNLTNSSLTLEISRCFSLHRVNSKPNFDENRPLNLNGRENANQPINSEKLFLFNHFFGVKALMQSLDPITQLLFNTKEFILERIQFKCGPGTNYKRPNYIALDFITNSTYSDLIEPLNNN